MEASEVLDTDLLIEGRTGLTTAFNIVEYPKALDEEIQVLWPVREDFVTAIGIMTDLLKVGKPVPALDVLISAVCINRGLRLLTRDEHFSAINSIRREFQFKLVK